MDLVEGKYYLVKSYGILNCAIVRMGKVYDSGRHVAYYGRSRVLLDDNKVVREASKEEADPRNYKNLYVEVCSGICN